MYNVAIIGATGMVGQTILSILDKTNFPIKNLKLFASEKNKNTKIVFKKQKLSINILDTNDITNLNGMDFIFSTAGAEISKKIVPKILENGKSIIIDNTSAFRMDNDIPLVLVGVNENDIKKKDRLIANPNCSTSQLVLVLKPLHDFAKIKKIIVSTYQAVSGAGKNAILELKKNTKNILNMQKPKNNLFAHNIAFNVIPQIDMFEKNSYTKEEMKVINETKKIMHLSNNISISCTAVRVPVINGHSEAVDIEFEEKISKFDAKKILTQSFGINVIDNISKNYYPTPYEISGKDPVFVGRIRENLAFKNGISLWICADNLRIGAALNSFRIANYIHEKYKKIPNIKDEFINNKKTNKQKG